MNYLNTIEIEQKNIVFNRADYIGYTSDYYLDQNKTYFLKILKNKLKTGKSPSVRLKAEVVAYTHNL
jgi:hypothetical protein